MPAGTLDNDKRIPESRLSLVLVGTSVMVMIVTSPVSVSGIVHRAISRSLTVTVVALCSHVLERPHSVAADPFGGFLDGARVFHAE
jgi:hypothetical protein